MKIRRILTFLVLTAVVWLAPVAQAHALNTSNFTIQSFNADYTLGRNAERRSNMRVIETITAVFPDADQNHGIERAIPNIYDNHAVGVAISSVTDEQKRALAYSTYESNDNTVLRIGDASRYVHGVQSYVITYDLTDVTKRFGDHDELFWDVNGTGWQQQFQKVTATLHIDKSIASAYNHQQRCYVGKAGSKETNCTARLRQTFAPTDDVTLDFATSRSLNASENLSFAVGFKSGTFAAYKAPASAKAFSILFLVWAVGNIVSLGVGGILLTRLWRRYGRQPKGKGTLVPQYLPPKEVSVVGSATILKKIGTGITAQIIDLAVRHYCKIYETKTKKFFGTKTTYDIELVRSIEDLRSEERAVATMLFGDSPAVGDRVAMKDLSNKLYKQAEVLAKTTRADLISSDFIAERSAMRKKLYIAGAIIIGASIVTVSPAVFIIGIASIILASAMWPLTQKGVDTHEYLLGLKEYMKMAEADRLRELQSPQGAEKTPVDTTDAKRLVHLYERILPYAILFGIEKEWIKQFADLYQEPPEWYAGNWAAFNAVMFADSISRFNSVATSSFAPPSDSSSSGFSGGASGGGGGGGGGGGW